MTETLPVTDRETLPVTDRETLPVTDRETRPGRAATAAVRSAVVTGIGVVATDRVDEPWFDVSSELGRRGFKYLPPAGQYLLAAARRAIADGGRLDGVAPQRRAVAVATNTGLATLFDDMDHTLISGTADELSPILAPFFAVTVLSTRLVVEHEVKGLSLTLTSPRVAGFEAIEAGARSLAAGRCDAVLAAAMEHGLPRHAAAAEQGAVALVFESPAAVAARGGGSYGSCRAATLFAPPGELAGADGQRRLAETLALRLRSLGWPAPERTELFSDGSAVGDAVTRAVTALAGGPPVLRPLGAGCLAPMRRVAELLAGPPAERLVLVATGEGNVAATRLSINDRSTGGNP
jgi:3-oxoacyl-[acyl-carrier-protein] synthase II